jgi:SNF2 family DNA or RNA helicase
MDNFRQLLQLSGFDSKPHQEEGVAWCLKNEVEGHVVAGRCVRGGLLADEMGLGKTIQMLGVVVANPKPRTLIVLPRALLEQWRDAIVSSLHHKPLVWHGAGQRGMTAEELATHPIVLTTYGMISAPNPKNPSPAENLLHKAEWDRVIYDEAHHLRNAKTLTHLGAIRLQAGIRWLVTGTPIQNSKSDFYSLCQAMGIPDAYYKKAINLLPLARQFMLKRTKKDVGLELSALRTEVIPTAWSNQNELELAEDIHALLSFSGSQKDLTSNKLGSLGSQGQLALLVRARQACVYPPLLHDAAERLIEEGLLEDSAELRQALRSSSKIDTVVASILERKQNGRNKLIFCHYRQEIDVIREDLARAGLHVETFDGRVSPHKRSAILTGQCDVLILQIKTGCEGLNLQQFSEVYFVSPHWNPAVEDQAVARCHRIGQTAQWVDVFRFHSKATGEEEGSKGFRTLDEYSAEKQAEKRILMDELVENERSVA